MLGKKYGETSFGERLQNVGKTRGMTQVRLSEAADTTQRGVSYHETRSRDQAEFSPAPAVIDLAKALKITTDEPRGMKPPEVERMNDAYGEGNGR
jgi:hypothetical protein